MKNLLLRSLENEEPYHWETLRGPSGASESSITFASQKPIFFFLVMVYDRVGDGYKQSYETFGLVRSRFHATSHLKIETKEFSM